MARPAQRAPASAPEPARSPSFARVTIANFFFFLNFASFFLLPLHVRALGGSERTIGLVMGTSGLSGLLGVVVVALLLDRLGRRVFLLVGLAGMGLTSAAFVAVHEVSWLLFALRAVQGLAFAAGFNAASTLAVDYAPPGRRAAALGLFGISTLTTHAIAPALGEQIVAAGGFQTLFLVAGAFSFVGLLIAWPLHTPRLAGKPGARRLRPTRALAAAIGTVGCCGVAFGSVLTYVPTFVHDADLGPVGTFFLAYTIAAVSTRLFAGRLGDSFPRRRVIMPALALLSAAIVGLASIGSTRGLAVTAVLFGVAQGFVYPTLNAFTIDLTEATQVGRAQAFYNGAFNLGTTLGSIALGPIVEAFGYRTMFLCAACLPAAALAIFGFGTRRARGAH
jgi:MFS family permease